MSLDQIIADALGTVRDVMGTSVTYHRGSNWIRLTAAATETRFEVDNGAALIALVSRDYLISACELDFGDGPVEPKAGDFVKEVIDGQTHVHEVGRPDGNDQVFRYSDTGRSQLRVHTKRKQIV
jgi:hypothetical protein